MVGWYKTWPSTIDAIDKQVIVRMHIAIHFEIEISPYTLQQILNPI
jgi:hypothetical protein